MSLSPPVRSALVLPILVGALLVSCASPAPRNGEVEILWDEWGVPHIFAADSEGLFFAHGWAQARSHGDLLLRLYGQSRGRAAEYWGEEQLDSDLWVHVMGVPERSVAWYEAQDPQQRRYLDAFCRGINAYAAEHADAIDNEVEIVLPIDGADVLAHVQRSIHFTFIAGPRMVDDARRVLEQRGSNAWAIAPSRSESGNAILVANPHLPWGDLFTWFESQLTSPDVDSYGVALIGMPFHGIAFNDYLGWTHTVNTHDGADLYELTPAGDDGYHFDGETRPFDVTRKTLRVKGADGSTREETLEVRSSVHGPIVAEKNGRALALRVVGLDSSQIQKQYWEMVRATDLEEFETALRQMQMPLFTVMYADRDGRVMHLFGGETPVRSQGDWSRWAGAVPGDVSETLWTESHAYDDLPRVVDPQTGWLQNANDPPWTTTFPPPLDPDEFPAYLAPRFMHFRAQRSARLLQEDDSLSFEEVIERKLSTRLELADRILDDVDGAVREYGGDLAVRANGVLQTWDRATEADSRGAVLFQAFVGQLGGSEAFASAWSEDDPRNTPDGLADPKAAVAALEQAARKVEADHGALDVPWGDVHRLRHGELDLPGNGGSGGLGIFRVVGYAPDEDKRFRARGGDSFVAVVEFSDPVRARVLLSYGNASQPGSPHAGDQLELFSRKELREVWRTREEIEPHLEEKEVLKPGA